MNFDKLTELALALPEQYKAAAQTLIARMGETIEGIGDEPVKWRPSIAKLVQAVSDRSKLPRGAAIGDLVLNESVLAKPTKVIVLRAWDARQYWSPDQNEAKMICSSPDAQLGYLGMNCRTCPHAKFDEEAKKTECNKIKVFLVITADLSDIFLVHFAKTNYKVGSDWQTTMKKAGVAAYRRVYGLNTETSKQYKNVETILIETYSAEAEKATPEELLPFLSELFVQVGADRKDMLDVFHKTILSRREDPSLLTAGHGADSDVVLITNGTESDVSVEGATGEDTPAPKQSAEAKKYKL